MTVPGFMDDQIRAMLRDGTDERTRAIAIVVYEEGVTVADADASGEEAAARVIGRLADLGITPRRGEVMDVVTLLARIVDQV